MKKLRTLLCTFVISAGLCAYSAQAADDFSKGSVNWTEGYIEAIGYGTSNVSGNKGKDRINARRAAEVSAQRALLEVIKGVHITSLSTVEESILKDDHIRTRVDGIIKGAQIIDDKVDWEGNSPIASVRMRICLNGGTNECQGTSLVNVLNLEKRPDPPFVPKVLLVKLPVTDKQKLPEPPAIETTPAKPRPFVCDLTKPVTGVVFTLEGRYFERALLPVVITTAENNEFVTVYSAKLVKPSVIRTHGAVRYAETVDLAVKHPQLGGNVLVVPVTDITKDNMVVISAQDAASIKETLAHGNDYLGDAKVVISVR